MSRDLFTISSDVTLTKVEIWAYVEYRRMHTESFTLCKADSINCSLNVNDQNFAHVVSLVA